LTEPWTTLAARVAFFNDRLQPIFWDDDARLYELVTGGN